MASKTFTILAISLIFLAFISLIPAKQFTWTQYSDSTSVDFYITESTDYEDDFSEYGNLHKDTTEEDKEPEQTTYGKWKCINTKLQRTNTINGRQEIQYGGVCGLTIPATEKKEINFLWAIPILLILINLILILAAAMVLLKY